MTASPIPDDPIDVRARLDVWAGYYVAARRAGLSGPDALDYADYSLGTVAGQAKVAILAARLRIAAAGHGRLLVLHDWLQRRRWWRRLTTPSRHR